MPILGVSILFDPPTKWGKYYAYITWNYLSSIYLTTYLHTELCSTAIANTVVRCGEKRTALS